MNEYDIKRLALIFAIQAEIEGMKVSNKIVEGTYSKSFFDTKAEELRNLAYSHNEQLF